MEVHNEFSAHSSWDKFEVIPSINANLSWSIPSNPNQSKSYERDLYTSNPKFMEVHNEFRLILANSNKEKLN